LIQAFAKVLKDLVELIDQSDEENEGLETNIALLAEALCTLLLLRQLGLVQQVL
jgi:hypothetical protein